MPGGANLQRLLTIDFLNKGRISAPAVWLDDAGSLQQVNTHEWEDDSDQRLLGVRLVNGLVELRIKSPDDTWMNCFFEAARHLKIDARAAYGQNRAPISSILLQVDDQENIDKWKTTWPKGWKDAGGQWVEPTFVYSSMETPRSKPVWRESSPLPGSRLKGRVSWRPNGKPAAELIELGLEDLEPRKLASTTMATIVRAIAFAAFLYWIRVFLDGLTEWDETLVKTVGGWLARAVREGRDINARGKSLENVCWAPIANEAEAKSLIEFLGPPRGLKDWFAWAAGELESNPVAKVAGWPALEGILGRAAKLSIRRVFRAGLDIDIIERLGEQYILDTSTHNYVDREALLRGMPYEHKHDNLVRMWAKEKVFIDNGKKVLNPFEIYAGSQMRTDVQKVDMFPGKEPAAILRFSSIHGLLSNENYQPDEYQILNNYRGFVIQPIGVVDPAVMRRALSLVDEMLALLTQDNDAQMLWLKKNIAWTIQHPDIKQQVCPVLIGGQGIGKSLFGNNLMRSQFGDLAGKMNSGAMSDNKFIITPFVGKLSTFLDEAKLQTIGAISDIKDIIRSVEISGETKFGHRKIYNIWSRVIIASNNPDIGLSPEDAADRCFFFVVGWSPETKRMSTREFQQWAIGLKPFYDRFLAALEEVTVKQHLMRYFTELPVERAELEDLTHSSRDDERVVKATMSRACEIARSIVADARIERSLDITAWFTTSQLAEAIKRHDGRNSRIDPAQILQEFEHAGVLNKVRSGLYYFKYCYGTLVEKMAQATNLPLEANFEVGPGDWGDNEVRSQAGSTKPWRGFDKKNEGRRSYEDRRDYDPDYANGDLRDPT